MSYIEERNKYWTIYPEHIDYRLSRRLGRKISLKFAVENPTLEEIIEACKSLKIPCKPEPDKAHPSNWIEKKGRIKTPKLKKISKRKLLKLLAHRIKQIRAKKVSVEKKETPQRKQVQRMLEKIIKR